MNIFLAASMRSGSTHICNSIQRMGWRKVSVHLGVPGYYNEEPMIDAHAAEFLFPQDGQVFHAHMRALGKNVPLLKMFKVPTVVIERNLWDCLISWKESCDLDHAAGRGDQYIYAPIYGAQWGKLTEGQQWDWMLYNVVPWYLSFHQSWSAAENDMRIHRIWYSDYFADQSRGLEDLAKFLDFAKIPRRALLEKMTAYQDGKLNKGISGRGHDLVPDHIKQAVLTQIYSWGYDAGANMERNLCARH